MFSARLIFEAGVTTKGAGEREEKQRGVQHRIRGAVKWNQSGTLLLL